MTIWYQCQHCKEQAEGQFRTRRPAYWSTVSIDGPRKQQREYDLCHPCATELAAFMNTQLEEPPDAVS